MAALKPALAVARGETIVKERGFRLPEGGKESDNLMGVPQAHLEILEERVVSSRTRRNPRGVKRKMSGYQLRPRNVLCNSRIEFEKCMRIIK